MKNTFILEIFDCLTDEVKNQRIILVGGESPRVIVKNDLFTKIIICSTGQVKFVSTNGLRQKPEEVYTWTSQERQEQFRWRRHRNRRNRTKKVRK